MGAWLISLFLCYWVLLVEGTDSLLSPKGVNYEGLAFLPFPCFSYSNFVSVSDSFVWLLLVAALMSLKSKMYGEFHVMDGWDINSVDPCTWYMVGCSAEGYVVSL